MSSSQSLFVSFTIQENVLIVHFSHSGHAFIDNVVITTVFSTLFGGEVGVAARTVPVALNGLGFEVHIHVELFSDTTQDVLG